MQVQVTENQFAGQTIFAGIDTHKKNWRVTMYCGGMEHKQMTIDPSAEVLTSYLKKTFPGAIYKAVYEAGFSGFTACRELNEQGVFCYVVHPSDVPTTQKERQQKTDSVDSRKLARMLMESKFESIDIPEVPLEADRALLRQRGRTSKDLSRTKNRVKSLLFQFGYKIPDCFTSQSQHWSGVFVKWLRELPISELSLRITLDGYISTGLFLRSRLLDLNRAIRNLSRTEVYKDPYELITKIPGIGRLTGMHFLVQIGDINRFTSLDKLNYYVGLAPNMHGSGEKIKIGKLVKRGRKDLKIMLIESCWTAVRHDPALMASFIEMTKRMPKNKAIIKIARKLLSRIRYVLKNKAYYQLGVVK